MTVAENNSSLPALSCSYCGQQLEEHERADPQMVDDEPVCDDCYREKYCFTCCRCEEYEDNEHQHKFLVVKHDECGELEVADGVYRIVRSPYHYSSALDNGLIKSALEFVCALPNGIELDDYPCGHLCLSCQGKLSEEGKEDDNG